MYFSEAFLLAALAAVPVLATGSSVNVYFGQAGDADIGDVCADSSFEYITLAFITTSPENGGASGLPGSNFAGHCWAGDYEANGHTSGLLSDCPSLTPGIDVCQTKYGKKVLLSIGGVFTEASNYSISSYENGVEFANFIWGAYGPYDKSWGSQPRPFDYDDVHVAVDGYDFDIETADAGDEGYKGMIETLRSLIEASGRNDIITGSPQCPLEDENQPMKYLLENVSFDRLWIQFYNNLQCEILNADGTPNSGFNYDKWETFLADTANANAKLHIGLPGSADASGSGYVDAAVAADTLCSSQSSGSMFGGLMVWDQTYAAANVDESGISYNAALYESMRCSCGECPEPTTTTTTVSSSTVHPTSSMTTSSSVAWPTPSSSPPQFSTSTDLTSVSLPSVSFTSTIRVSSHLHSHTPAQHSSVVISSPLGPSGPASHSSSSTTTLSSSAVASTSKHPHSHTSYTYISSISPSGSGVPHPSSILTGPSSTKPTGGISSSLVGSSGPSPISTDSVISSQTTSIAVSSAQLPTQSQPWSNSTWTSSAVNSFSSPAISDSASSTAGTSSVRLSTRPHSWSNTTWTSQASYVSGTDATQSSFPTSSSVDTATTSGSGASADTSSSIIAASSSTAPAEVTETIWTTTVYTVTSCAASVTDCPAGTHYSTSSWALSTTVVPASSTSSVAAQQGSTTSSGVFVTSASSSVAGSSPTASSVEEVTSTIWSTEVHTITSCAATVTDCPAGTHYSTTSFPVSTTILPGSATSKVGAQSETVSSSSEQWTTSTIFSTTIYTVTYCAATITDCPARIGSVTTEIIAVTTTVCPVTAAGSGSTLTSSSSPVETGTTGSGSTGGSSSSGSSSGSTGSESGKSGSQGSSNENTGSSSGSSPERVGSSPDVTTTGTLTRTAHVFSTVFVTVPTSSSTTTSLSSAAASSAPEAVNNAGAPGPLYSAPSSFSIGPFNETATKTYSLSKVFPTTVGASGSTVPSKGTSATSPIVTAGASRSISGVGLIVLVGVVALIL